MSCSSSSRSVGESIASSAIKVSELPSLNGSPKQIEWANKIRAEFVNQMNDYLDSDDVEYDVRTDARDVMDWAFKGGVSGSYQNSYADNMYDEIRKKNPELTIPERDEKVHQFVVGINNEAQTAYRELKAQSKDAAKIAKAKVYKKYARKFLKHELGRIKNASTWIDKYKYSRYDKR